MFVPYFISTYSLGEIILHGPSAIVNLFLENPKKGGERIAYLAISDEVKEISGKYFYKTEDREVVISAQERGKTEKLLQIAEELTGLQR